MCMFGHGVFSLQICAKECSAICLVAWFFFTRLFHFLFDAQVHSRSSGGRIRIWQFTFIGKEMYSGRWLCGKTCQGYSSQE